VSADEVVAREPVEAEDGEVQRQSTAELVLPLTGAGLSIRSTAELVLPLTGAGLSIRSTADELVLPLTGAGLSIRSTAELVLPLTGAGLSIRSTAELVAVDAVERKGLVERRVQRLANHTCLHLATATRQRL